MKHPKSKRSYEPAPPPRIDALDAAPPMRRRRGAFYVLLTVFAVWIVALLVMYFTTVRTHGGRLAPLPTTNDLR